MKPAPAVKIVSAAAVAVWILSCGFLEEIIPAEGDSTGRPSDSQEGGEPDAMEELTDPRVEETLALRSVQMTLQSAFPGESASRILMSIDAEGNQRIEKTTPVPEESTVTPESPDWNVLEIFVVDGSAYTRMGKTGHADINPLEDDALSDLLYGPTGPGMWLILLPEESFTSAGTESIGGFDAEKFSVNGSLDDGTIRGEFWVDRQMGALIGAEITVPEVFYYPVEEGADRTVTIQFIVEKADVPAITVPVE